MGAPGRSKRLQKKRGVSLCSTRRYGALDKRTIEGREEEQIIAGLVAHLGGRPTFPQLLLIKRIARANMILDNAERQVLETCELGDLQSRQLNALQNTVIRGLEKLGLTPAEAPKTLKAYVGGKAA